MTNGIEYFMTNFPELDSLCKDIDSEDNPILIFFSIFNK